VSVPAWIMAILYADPIAAGLARSGVGKWCPFILRPRYGRKMNCSENRPPLRESIQ
jgi:hypothetical protein